MRMCFMPGTQDIKARHPLCLSNDIKGIVCENIPYRPYDRQNKTNGMENLCLQDVYQTIATSSKY